MATHETWPASAIPVDEFDSKQGLGLIEFSCSPALQLEWQI